MLSKKEQYKPTEDMAYTEKIRTHAIKNMQKKLKRLNMSLEEIVCN